MTRSKHFLLCVFAVLAFLFSSRAMAQDKTSDDSKSAKATDAAEEKTKDNSLREQEIYIPYDKLRTVFEKHGRGVYLPYEKFEELWKAAQDKTRPAAAPRPPVGAVITEIENEATVAKDVVQVTARLKIDLLSEGWHEVPLRLADAAISRATIKNEPARILGGASGDHRLLIEHKGKQPEQIELVLEYAKAISRSPGQNSVSFQAPQAAVSRWKVRIPQSGVKVNLRPMIAATEVPSLPSPSGRGAGGEDGSSSSTANKTGSGATSPHPGPLPEGEGETVVLAFVGAAPTVEIDWTPKAEGATGLTALASVQSEQVIWVQEGITRVRTNLVYTISRAELKELSLEVPTEFKVVNVFDPNVRRWSVSTAEGAQKIAVQLFEPAKATQTVVVELEKIADQKRRETLKVPVVKALNVGRQQGFVVAQVTSELRADVAKTSGLLQIDANELPATLRTTPWTFAYRYAAVPFELELALEEVQPRITVESLVQASLTPESLSIDLQAFYNIERAGVFKLELDVPEGYDVRSVAGVDGSLAVSPGAPPASYAAVNVESHHLDGEKKNRLVVNLSHRAMGRVGLKLQLRRELDDANLIAPTGKASEIDLPVPQPRKGTVEQSAGRLVVFAPESLRVNPIKSDGLRPVSAAEATSGIVAMSAPTSVGNAQPVLAFMFTQEAIALKLSAERKKPDVTVRQLLVARIEEGVVKYEATFYYTILYSGVKSLRIDVPADVAPLLHNTTQGIHEKTIDPPPAGLENGMVAWSLAGEGELLGERQIKLVWEKKLDKLDVGKPIAFDVPRLVPRDVNRASGQIVLAKAETLGFDQGDNLKDLRPIDPQRDVMSPVAGASRAFAFEGEWSLPVTVTRFELEEVKRTSIDRAVCRMVITPAGETAVQAIYRVRSVQPRLSVQLPAGATPDSDPVRINGQPVTLQKGEKDALVVPLVNANADEPFVLEVRYVLKAGQPLTPPAFPDEAAVQKVYLCAFVPSAQDVIATSGRWSEDFQWLSRNDGRRIPFSPISHDQRVAWVCESNGPAASAASTFHFDGTPLVFSTLRPDAKSTVSLWSIDHQTLNGWIFGLTLLAGVALVWTTLRVRLMAVAMLLLALVLLGVFWPTLALHVLGPPLYWAVAIVVLLWVVSAPFIYARRIRELNQAINTTWTTWVADNKARAAAAIAANAPVAKTPSPDQPSTTEGGTSHE